MRLLIFMILSQYELAYKYAIIGCRIAVFIPGVTIVDSIYFFDERCF